MMDILPKSRMDLAYRVKSILGILESYRPEIDAEDVGRLELLSLFLKFFNRFFNHLNNEKLEEFDHRWARTCMFQIKTLATQLTTIEPPHIEDPSPAISPYVSPAISPFFDRIAQQVRPGTTLIIHSKLIVSSHFDQTVDLLENVFDHLKQAGNVLEFTQWERILYEHTENILLIKYPQIEGILISPIIAHEFGHFIAKKMGYQEVRITKVEAGQSDGKISSMDAARVNKWLEELMCDILGFKIMGPAFYWAFHEWLLLSHPFVYNVNKHAYKSHPHPALRLMLSSQLAIDFLTSLAPTEDPKKLVTNAVQHRIDALKKEQNIFKEKLPKGDSVIEFIEGFAGYFSKLINNTDNSFHFREENLNKEIGQLFFSLENDIAPVEILQKDQGKGILWDSKPADWRSILNTAWIKHLEDRENAESLADRVEVRHDLEEFIICSLEANNSAVKFREERDRR